LAVGLSSSIARRIVKKYNELGAEGIENQRKQRQEPISSLSFDFKTFLYSF
jgi:hypothetical protein